METRSFCDVTNNSRNCHVAGIVRRGQSRYLVKYWPSWLLDRPISSTDGPYERISYCMRSYAPAQWLRPPIALVSMYWSTPIRSGSYERPERWSERKGAVPSRSRRVESAERIGAVRFVRGLIHGYHLPDR